MPNLNIKPNNVLISPHVTEKAAIAAERRNVYVFKVAPKATKKAVIASVREAYKVTPESVRVLAVTKKQVFVRGKRGSKGGGKKAYVYLKKGDKIEVI
ncbi:MAG: 50S ribosomal protein L23 [bacterium]|nr:50S ribosomal protein L23 [bacterium]